jgi:hypothetical protein
MFKGLKMLGVAAAAAVLMAVPAQAATVIDFQTGLGGEGGSITWDSAGMVGSNIPIGAVTISGAPTNNRVFTVTGSAAGSGIGGPFGSLDFSTAADTISITGCIAELNIGGSVGGPCNPVVLLSGTFTTFTLSNEGLTDARGEDVKNTELLNAIGFPTDLPWQFYGFSVNTAGNLTMNGEADSVISTDIRNTAVPEPATMMLLGTGLLAAFRARRKQQA